MYRLTLSRGLSERHFPMKELIRETGIRSDKTIRVAIDGLLEKRSIEMVSYHHGQHIGAKYRVHGPREVLERRREAGVEIHEASKKVITPVTTPVITGVESTAVRPVRPVKFTGVTGLHEGSKSWENQDDDLVVALRALFPTEPAERLEQTVTDLHTILAAFAEQAAARASTPPAHSAFITKCVRTALAARDAVERLRTPPKASRRDPGAAERPDEPEDPVYQIRKVAVQLREMHRAEGGYSGADLRDDVKEVCATAGIAYTDALIEEALGKVGL
jgi:hypothetical protein